MTLTSNTTYNIRNEEFALNCLQLHLHTLEPVNLPPFAGSTWRGALGQALRRVVCVCPNTLCQGCVMQPVCWYAKLYESAINHHCNFLQGYVDAPHPLIPLPSPLGGTVAADTAVRLDLLLIGDAHEAVPFLIQAVQRLAAHGVGANRGSLELIHWDLVPVGDTTSHPWQPPTLWPRVRLTLNTPLRLRVDNRVLKPINFNMRPFLTSLLRRISLFTCCHNTNPVDLDFKGLAHIAELVTITEQKLKWFCWSRYSSTQKRHIDMDGLMGELTIDLSQAPEWWPYLWVGQWLHVGKGASMGMGSYSLIHSL